VKLNSTSGPTTNKIPVVFQSPNRLSSKVESGSIVLEISCPTSSRILEELESVVEIETQLYCHSKVAFPPSGNATQNGRHRGKPSQRWILNAIIFGTNHLVEAVGEYLSKKHMYLQDPLGCERPVLYRNPHVIPPVSEEDLMADSFDCPLGNLEIERLEAGPNLLAQLMEDEIPLRETEAPAIVETPLFWYVSSACCKPYLANPIKSHQKQALTFMLRRENGWALESRFHDIWSRQTDSLGRTR
jgi:hypothetical protein